MNLSFVLNMVSIALVVLAAVIGILYLLHFLRYRSGKLAHAKVAGALRRFGIIRNYKILENLHLRYGNREARIDCMLIGFFGILLVHAVNDTAEYYGDVGAPHWVKVMKEKRSKMENLCAKNTRDIELIREIFAKNNVYGIQLEGLVVFCGNVKKTIFGITGGQGLMNFKNFKAYLGKSKFEKDNDVDVPGLAELILKYRVTE